jgi:hypothetical protein
VLSVACGNTIRANRHRYFPIDCANAGSGGATFTNGNPLGTAQQFLDGESAIPGSAEDATR